MSETNTVTGQATTLRISTKDGDQKKCGKCSKNIKAKDKYVQCGTCNQVFHAKCQGVSDKKHELLQEEGEDTLWLCIACNKTTRGLIQHVSRLEQRMDALEVKVDKKASKEQVKLLEDRVAAIEEQERLDPDTEELAKKLEEKLKEQQEIIERNAVKRFEETRKQDRRNSEIAGSTLTDAVKELEDRERRKNSLVIHNFKESTEVNPDSRKLDDAARIKSLISDHLKLKVEFLEDQNGQPMVLRLGKKSDTKSRSVKITLSPQDAGLVLKNAKNLNSSEDADIKKVIIKPDLTKMQREEEMKLVKEKNEKNKAAKEKNEPEDWIIQRWKVVRRRKPQKADAQTSNTSLNEEFKDATQ